jgi:phage gp37-like protein
MSIAATEQYFIDDIKAAFNGRLKGVESLPAQWDDRTFERIFRAAPGVFVVFAGGPRLPQFQDGVVIDATWVFAAVTTHASGELARRRGDSREIGAYEILEILAARYEGAEIPGALGPMHVDDVQNLFDDAIENQGAALYALSCRLPTLLAPSDSAAPTLDDFLTFHDQVDLAPVDGQPEAADLVELDQ